MPDSESIDIICPVGLTGRAAIQTYSAQGHFKGRLKGSGAQLKCARCALKFTFMVLFWEVSVLPMTIFICSDLSVTQIYKISMVLWCCVIMYMQASVIL